MFRDQVRDMDDAVFDQLGDVGYFPGRTEPVRGMFSAPWLQPTIGKLNTSVSEPHFVVRNADATGLRKNDQIRIDGEPDAFAVVSIEPDGSGMTTLVLR